MGFFLSHFYVLLQNLTFIFKFLENLLEPVPFSLGNTCERSIVPGLSCYHNNHFKDQYNVRLFVLQIFQIWVGHFKQQFLLNYTTNIAINQSNEGPDNIDCLEHNHDEKKERFDAI